MRKFLVCGKQLYFASKKLEDVGATKILNAELLLPISLYWEVQTLLKKMDYMTSANDDPVQIAEVYQKILRKCVKYAVFEKDRAALQEKLSGGS